MAKTIIYTEEVAHDIVEKFEELLDDCQEAKDTLMEIARRLQEAIK